MDLDERMRQFQAISGAMTRHVHNQPDLNQELPSDQAASYLRQHPPSGVSDQDWDRRIQNFGFQDTPLQRIIIHVNEKSSSDEGWILEVSCGDKSTTVCLTDPFSAGQEESLRRSIEDHAIREPFDRNRCRKSFEDINKYGNYLYKTLQIDDLISDHKDISEFVLSINGKDGVLDIHRLHWEALENPDFWPRVAEIPQQIAVRRGFLSVPVVDKRVKVSFNILYIVARPFDSNYIEYRLLSRRLLQIISRINEDAMDVRLHILRPGTWRALVSYLDSVRQSKGQGHVDLVHFDMHGRLDSLDGRDEYLLDFVSEEDQSALPVRAIDVAVLLAQHGVRTAILNSCESASHSTGANPNLAALFIKHGVASVVAMSYKLNSHGAEVFVEGFYNSLLDGVPDVTKAAADGRKAMRDATQRRGRYGTMLSLHDWIIPVHYFLIGYQLSGTSITRAGDLVQYDLDGKANLWPMAPERVLERFERLQIAEAASSAGGQVHEGGSFYGRDSDIHHLENLLSDHASRTLCLSGPPQVGKTALLRHLMPWWYDSSFSSVVGYSSADTDEAFDLLENWTRAIEFYERSPAKSDLQAESELPKESKDFVTFLKRGQPATIIVDHLDVLNKWVITGIEKIERMISIIARRKETRTRIIMVGRSPKVFEILGLIAQGCKHLQLRGLSSYDAADLAAEILTRNGGLSEAMNARTAVALEHVYKLLDYLPGVLETELPRCSVSGASMRPEDLLERLQYAEPDFPIRTTLYEVFEPLFHREGPLGNEGITTALFLVPFRNRCPVNLFPYFLRLVKNERFFPLEVSDEQIQRVRTEMRATPDLAEVVNLDDDEIISILRAQVTEIYFGKMLDILSKSGLLQKVAARGESKHIWIHPGLTLFLRKLGGPRNPFIPYIERAFSHFMVHSNGNSARIRCELDNYIVAAHLAEPLVENISLNRRIFTFTEFTQYFIHGLLRAFDKPKYDYETAQLTTVMIRAISRKFIGSPSRQEFLSDLEWCLWCLIKLGDRPLLRKGTLGIEEARPCYELAVELGNGIALPPQAHKHYDTARSRIALLRGEDQEIVEDASPLTEAEVQFGKSIIELRLASKDAVAPSEKITLLFKDCQSAWTRLKDMWAETEGQMFSTLATKWATDILEAGEDDSCGTLDQRALAFGKAEDHENDKQQGDLCFRVELAIVKGDLKNAEKKIHQGLEIAVSRENLSGEYDFCRYLLELREISNPSEDNESLREQLVDLCGRLGRNKEVFCPCRKSRNAARRSMISTPRDKVAINDTITALRDAFSLCKLPDHQHRILISLYMLNEENETNMTNTAIAYLGLCCKSQTDGFVRSGNLGLGARPAASPFTLLGFCPMLMEKAGESDEFLGGYLWKFDMEALKDIELLSGLAGSQITEMLIRAEARATYAELQNAEVEELSSNPQRLQEIRRLSWKIEETSLFNKTAPNEASGAEVGGDSHPSFGIDEAGLLQWLSVADGRVGKGKDDVLAEDVYHMENNLVGKPVYNLLPLPFLDVRAVIDCEHDIGI